MQRETTYYWRVDEVQEDGTVVTGDVWSFRTGSLVAAWGLDRIENGLVLDATGGGLDGTVVGDVSIVEGIVGNALLFDGDGDYVDLGKDSAFDITGQITIAAWVKVNAFDKQWQSIVTKGDSAWRLQRNSGTSTLEFAGNGLIVQGNRWSGVYGQVDVNDGNWHHAVGTYDGKRLALYVDGRLDVSSSAKGKIRINEYPAQIGANAEKPDRPWNGLIDEVRLYNYALSEADIRALYEAAAVTQ